MNKHIIHIIKASIIILIASIGFYIVCPKYDYIKFPDRVVRFNKVTGDISVMVNIKGNVTFISDEEYMNKYILPGKQYKESEPEKKRKSIKSIYEQNDVNKMSK